LKQSAGILVFRRHTRKEVFLVHPGGPFWMNKDLGSWSIPKGEINEKEDPLAAAIREFEEETGKKLSGQFIPLLPVKQKAGKIISAWMIEDDLDEEQIVSNHFTIEWPPKSGKMKSFPEIDKAAWFSLDEAKQKINPGQMAFIEAVEKI
jgi:predicted NUDIX family NTP pyrophosphohydrolase